ncbi:hypothetical protein TNCV_1581811 [Trichonephila clavipes]|nr:hypothetical protein TNCV_1581811 [Trichonephila clavipes]
MSSPVQSNCDAHDTIANGQYGAIWSMGHTQQSVGVPNLQGLENASFQHDNPVDTYHYPGQQFLQIIHLVKTFDYGMLRDWEDTAVQPP